MYCNNTGLTSLNVSNNVLLETLHCHNTALSGLDVSNNTQLETLLCYNTSLTSLNILNGVTLETLYCYNTPLTSIDFSDNTYLRNLQCYNTGLISLDLSNSIDLETLLCNNTSLESLNIANGNNINVDTSYLDFTNNPNLTCIQVDNETYSTTNWSSFKDNTASFSINCPSNCYVTLPDANFKAALVANTLINTDSDSEISCDEASNFTGTIDVENMSISDLEVVNGRRRSSFLSDSFLDCPHNNLHNNTPT